MSRTANAPVSRSTIITRHAVQTVRAARMLPCSASLSASCANLRRLRSRSRSISILLGARHRSACGRNAERLRKCLESITPWIHAADLIGSDGCLVHARPATVRPQNLSRLVSELGQCPSAALAQSSEPRAEIHFRFFHGFPSKIDRSGCPRIDDRPSGNITVPSCTLGRLADFPGPAQEKSRLFLLSRPCV